MKNEIETKNGRLGIICSFSRTQTNILEFKQGSLECPIRILAEPKLYELYGTCLFVLNSLDKIERVELHHFDVNYQ